MRKVYKLIISLLFLFIGIKAYAQEQNNKDSLWADFSNKLRHYLYDDLQNVLSDTNNFVGVYSFKFVISEKKVEKFFCSKGTSIKLCQSVKKTLTRLIDSAAVNKESLICHKEFILPIVLDYEGNVRKDISKNITIDDIINLTLFEDTPQKKSATSFVYSGIPIDCILLPTFFYKTPHLNSTPVNKFKL